MNTLVRNESQAAKPVCQSLICNLLPKSVRHDTMEGRDFIVVPMVILTEGVHCGSGGKAFYPKDELAKTPAVWNYKPVVVYHPEMDGVGISACDPTIITSRKVGVMMNTKFEKGRLKSEAWIEAPRANLVDPRIMAAIESGTMMELSTGVFVDVEETEGKWGKEEYDHIARNYRPDHLALLPDLIGACSIQDGAGFLRNASTDKRHQARVLWEKALKEAGITNNELSFSNIREALNTALRKRFGSTGDNPPFLFVEDVYSEFVVYELGGKLFQLGYEANDTSVTLSGEKPNEVVRVTEYRTPTGAFVSNTVKTQTKPKTKNMKETLILAILAFNSAAWTEADRPKLESLSEKQLEDIKTGLTPAPAPAPVVNKEEPKPATSAPAPAPVANKEEPKPATPLTAAEYIAAAPPAVQEVLRNSMAVHDEEKARLVATIIANKSNPFPKENLEARTLVELRGLAKLAGASMVAPVANYGGQAPVSSDAPAAEEAMEMPTINFAKK